MKRLGPIGIILMLFLTACSATRSKQEAELVENGFTAMSGGDYHTAEYLLNQALVLNDKNPYALLNLGVIYHETQRYDKAREFYQSVIDMKSSKTAASTNVQGYSGKKLADIARINMGNLPPAEGSDFPAGDGTDLDGDGVPNDLDQCGGTPMKADVMANGCWALTGIFPPGRTDIGPDAHAQLDEVVMVLLDNPSLRIEIQGHTDNSGKALANRRLSEKRAKSVMQYLIQRGIKPTRLQWAGYGQTRPIATNDTSDGRKQNRRVGFSPIP
jgi:tetratricopeptide (TPR) repeat protein